MRSHDIRNLQWSLKPIITLMKIVGIRIVFYNSSSVFGRLEVKSVFLIIFSLMIGEHLWFFKEQINFLKKNSFILEEGANATAKERQETLLHNSYILIWSALWMMLCCLPYLVLFLSTLSKKWKNLWLGLLKIEKNFLLRFIFYRQVRKHCYIGLLILLLVK